jgi:hypothetical protein
MAARLVPGRKLFGERVEGIDLMHFLKHSSKGDVPVWAAATNLTLRSAIAPATSVNLSYLSALMNGGVSGVAISGYGSPGPWDGASLWAGEPIYGNDGPVETGLRPLGLDGFYGKPGALGRLSALYAMVERGGAYCPVDRRGRDVVEAVKDEDVMLGTVRREVVGWHLRTTGSVLLRVLDVRHDQGCRSMNGGCGDDAQDPDCEIFARSGGLYDAECWVRAVQVVRG